LAVPSGLNPATLCHYQDRLALSGQAADSVADELGGDDQAHAPQSAELV
jgi:hypothetical protein